MLHKKQYEVLKKMFRTITKSEFDNSLDAFHHISVFGLTENEKAILKTIKLPHDERVAKQSEELSAELYKLDSVMFGLIAEYENKNNWKQKLLYVLSIISLITGIVLSIINLIILF